MSTQSSSRDSWARRKILRQAPSECLRGLKPTARTVMGSFPIADLGLLVRSLSVMQRVREKSAVATPCRGNYTCACL
jgi:hypothetical protein